MTDAQVKHFDRWKPEQLILIKIFQLLQIAVLLVTSRSQK
jgi:hypothetical protein